MCRHPEGDGRRNQSVALVGVKKVHEPEKTCQNKSGKHQARSKPAPAFGIRFFG